MMTTTSPRAGAPQPAAPIALRATRTPRPVPAAALIALIALTAACTGGSGGDTAVAATAESCMTCHNGSTRDDYAGPGMPDPHPFVGAKAMTCTTCHGGDPSGETAEDSHVPPPPEIGDDEQLEDDPTSYFNRLTLTGIDRFDDYEVDGVTYSALDYLQFVNPGDLRVVDEGRSCGACHGSHVAAVVNSPLATGTGIFSGAGYAIGADNALPAQQGLYEDTAADLGFRAAHDPSHTPDPDVVGAVRDLLEFPVISAHGDDDPHALFQNDLYAAADLVLDVHADNRVVTDSPLHALYLEQVAFTCGDCHLGSAGANNRYGDFRSSGCSACHMPYARDGRYDGSDPNVDRAEPADPDRIRAPERAHVDAHRIVSTARSDPGTGFVHGIDDYACAGCHQGSNRTVMQYWGIRLDQNQDLRRGVQYPANPVSYVDTRDDERLFDPDVGNQTFNGRNARQYILFEDYDGDGRDDTPADVHHEAGMGCIDCHGSKDLHGGDVSDGDSTIWSRMEHAVTIGCTDCHGTIDAYAETVPGVSAAGLATDLVVDRDGDPLSHVERDADGRYWLTSKLTGERHYLPQTRDTVVDSGVTHPADGDPIYSIKASFAMGRDDGDPSTGIGPVQAGSASDGFCHADSMDCASCHAAWTNTCAGCHLEGEYDTSPDNFSNITGERIVYREADADFVYQSPIPFQLGIGPHDRITQMSANTKMFYRYEDRLGDTSETFAFSDRQGAGHDPAAPFAALSHNAMLAHSIRGRVDPANEGPRSCAACHLTEDGLAAFGEAEYQAFRADLASGDYGDLDYELLAEHIGRNPGNQLESPVFVHMVAGLGSGLFLFDEHGGPVNPLDPDDDRAGCDGVAPADVPFDPARAVYDLDRIVEADGSSNASNNHALMTADASAHRDGADDPRMAGPLGAETLRTLTDPELGVVLDAWTDADGEWRGAAPELLDGP